MKNIIKEKWSKPIGYVVGYPIYPSFICPLIYLLNHGERGKRGRAKGKKRGRGREPPPLRFRGPFHLLAGPLHRMSNVYQAFEQCFQSANNRGKDTHSKKGAGGVCKEDSCKTKTGCIAAKRMIKKSIKILKAFKWVVQNCKMYSKGMSIWCRMKLLGASYRAARSRDTIACTMDRRFKTVKLSFKTVTETVRAWAKSAF